jgi:hypothetical protein
VDQEEEYGFTLARRLDFLDAIFFQRHQIWVETEVRRIARAGFIDDDAVTQSGGTTWLLLRLKMTL